MTRKARKKPPVPRVRLTHLEVRCGKSLRLRISVANEVMDEIGDELGGLIKKMASCTRQGAPIAATEDLILTRVHSDSDDDASYAHSANDAHYHANVREQLVEMISALCDTSLADALKIAKDEHGRRAEGVN